MPLSETQHPDNRVVIGLNAVLAAIEGERPLVLATRSAQDPWSLPYGAFDPERHRTFELGLRDFVSEQTNMPLGYVEQLYTFGDRGREAPRARIVGGAEADRVVSVGYLALARTAAPVQMAGIAWRCWYDHFPWEDWRDGQPGILGSTILPALTDWQNDAATPGETEERRTRVSVAFGLDGHGWQEERALDRYELMYEAGLVTEAIRDGKAATGVTQTGIAMVSDHRRILATAIGRLRGKLRYRPVIFEMLAEQFTLLELQQAVEAILGFSLHKQNFRRGIENAGLVRRTGATASTGVGRPAALFEAVLKTPGEARDRSVEGLSLPRMRIG